MINYFDNTMPFKVDCTVNYRLSIIENIHNFTSLKHLYYINNKVQLYKSPKQLLSMFRCALIQTPLSLMDFNENILKEQISKHNYILGLFDTFELKHNTNYKRIHNYNTFIIRGFDSSGFLLFCNGGTSKPVEVHMNFHEIKKIICYDVTSIRNLSDNHILGFPLSVITPISNTKNICKSDVIEYLYNFYFNQTKCENFNIFQQFIDDKLLPFVFREYCGSEYQNISNLKTLQDMFVYQNIIINNKISMLERNNNELKVLIDIIISIYAKYIYSYNTKYIEKMYLYFLKVNEKINKNKQIIESL